MSMPATLGAVGALACWSIGPLCVKYLTGHFDLWSQNFYRYLTACLFWLPFLLYAVRRKRLAPGLWRRALLPAAINIVMQSFWAASFYHLDPGFMILLSKSSLLWIAALSMLLFPAERRLLGSARFWTGATLAVIGLVGVIAAGPAFSANGSLVGIAIGLTASFLWALYVMSARVAFQDTDSRLGFAVTCLYTTVGLGVAALLLGEPVAGLPVSASAWAGVVVSGITAIALSHVLFYAAMRRIGATIPSVLNLVTPFTILAVSRLVFGETMTPLQILFGVTLVVGGALSLLAQKRLPD